MHKNNSVINTGPLPDNVVVIFKIRRKEVNPDRSHLYGFIVLVVFFLARAVTPTLVAGQNSLYTGFSVGYGFNTSGFVLGNERVEGIQSGVLSGDILLGRSIQPPFFISAGLGGRYIASRGTVASSSYGSWSVKFVVPLYIGFQLDSQTEFLAGVTVRNNKDFKNIHIRSSHNIRLDYGLMVRYAVSPRWLLTFMAGYDMGVPSLFLLQDPQISLQIGVSYPLFSGKTTGINGSGIGQ